MLYHQNLSLWVKNSIIDLVAGIDPDSFWDKRVQGNSPGWTLGHLIVENDLMLEKLGGASTGFLREQRDQFGFGSSGIVASTHDKALMIEQFSTSQALLSQFIADRFQDLSRQAVENHPMGSEFQVELDESLHLEVSHPAMHLALLQRWLKAA